MSINVKPNYMLWANFALGSGIVLVIVAPWLFTLNTGLLDFRGTGEIGDTIGGITAPIVNLTGAILVYFAFRAQVEANRLVQNQIEDQKIEEITRRKRQYINEKINIVRNDIIDFTFSYTETSGKLSERKKLKHDYAGSNAVNKLIGILKQLPEHFESDLLVKIPKLTELYLLLHTINVLLDDVGNESFIKEDKEFFKSLIAYHYNSKIKPAFNGNEEFRARNAKPCSICGNKHGKIPDKIFDLVDLIDTKLI